MPHTNAATTIRMPKSTLPRIILVSAIEIAAIPSAMYQELIGIYHLSGGVQHHFCTWYSVTPVIRTLAFAFRTTTELSLQKWCWTTERSPRETQNSHIPHCSCVCSRFPNRKRLYSCCQLRLSYMSSRIAERGGLAA